jgi:alkylhydroperoxidase family enzyme
MTVAITTSPDGPRPRAEQLRLSPPIATADSVREILDRTAKGHDGTPLLLFQILAHHEQLLRKFNSFGALLRTSTVTTLREREIVILRTAHLTDCPFEFEQHRPLAEAAGLSAYAVAAAGGGRRDHLVAKDLLLLDVADEMYRWDSVSENTWDRLAIEWTPEQVIELVMTAGFFRMAAGIINAIGLRPPETW